MDDGDDRGVYMDHDGGYWSVDSMLPCQEMHPLVIITPRCDSTLAHALCKS